MCYWQKQLLAMRQCAASTLARAAFKVKAPMAKTNYIQSVAPWDCVFSLFLIIVLGTTYIYGHMHWHFCDILK
jgi:hypothetical protein